MKAFNCLFFLLLAQVVLGQESRILIGTIKTWNDSAMAHVGIRIVGYDDQETSTTGEFQFDLRDRFEAGDPIQFHVDLPHWTMMSPHDSRIFVPRQLHQHVILIVMARKGDRILLAPHLLKEYHKSIKEAAKDSTTGKVSERKYRLEVAKKADEIGFSEDELLAALENVTVASRSGFLNLTEYLNTNRALRIGLAIGLQSGNRIALGNIPLELRTVAVHPMDTSREDLLPPDISPDKYFVSANRVNIDLGIRSSLDINISLLGLVNFTVRTTAIRASSINHNQNLFRKNYVDTLAVGAGGDAFIYYAVKSKSRRLFSKESFSLPISVTYPIFFVGKNRGTILKLVGGTNILLPHKIKIESEKGWDRFAELEVLLKENLGELKEVEWFGGLDIEITPIQTLRIGFQFTVVYTDYRKNFKFPLTLQLKDSVRPSLRLNVIKLF